MTLWDFLNSNFAIWALSSVVVASLSRLFLSWKERANRKAAARSERDDLLLEIEVRTRVAMAHAQNPGTVHLAQSGPLRGPIAKYRDQDYLQLLFEAECRLGGRIQGSPLTQKATAIAGLNAQDSGAVNKMISLYEDILSYVLATRTEA